MSAAAWPFALATCAATPEEPPVPDVSALLTAYASPSGVVDPRATGALTLDARAQLELLGGGEASMLVTGLIDEASARLDDAALPATELGPIRFRVDGVVTLQVPCGPAPDAHAQVAVQVADGRLTPLLWGRAHGCLLWESLGASPTFDGGFVMYRYPSGGVLVQLDGATASGAALRADFRLVDGLLETRLDTANGDVIVSSPARNLLSIRAANGTFRCDPNGDSCE